MPKVVLQTNVPSIFKVNNPGPITITFKLLALVEIVVSILSPSLLINKSNKNNNQLQPLNKLPLQHKKVNKLTATTKPLTILYKASRVKPPPPTTSTTLTLIWNWTI
jgi:hypothetical protein